MSAERYIPLAAPDLTGAEARYVNECLESTWISSAGRFIGEFEERFADFCGVGQAVATNNGTTALHLSLVALGIAPGDEVIVPTLTYVATANVVRYCGATPVFVDCEPVGMTMDVEDVRRKITSRTKAILPVHLYGNAANMPALQDLAESYGIALVEDAAEAHGASVGGRKVGALGDCAAFSFFGNKIITTGEGGAITTDNSDLASTLRLYRGQGMDPTRRYWFSVIGYNYRMTNIAAAIGLAQLEDIERKLSLREEIRISYNSHLQDYVFIDTPQQPPWSSSVNWIYTVSLDVSTAAQRDSVANGLAEVGIETRPVFYPLHTLPPYLEPKSLYPVAESCARKGLSLPTHLGLDEADIRRICQRLVAETERVRRDPA